MSQRPYEVLSAALCLMEQIPPLPGELDDVCPFDKAEAGIHPPFVEEDDLSNIAILGYN